MRGKMTAGTLLKSFALGLDEQAIIKMVPFVGNSYSPSFILKDASSKGISKREPAKYLRKPTSYVSYVYKGIDFKLIGCPEQGQIKESAGKEVDKQDIFMGETEVTQELYEAVMGYNPSGYMNEPDSSQRPVETVSWYDCIDFCNRLSVSFGLQPYYTIEIIEYDGYTIESANVEAEGGYGFRLPTDAEWVMFAKAGTQNPWAGTSDLNEVKRVAWFKDNSNDQTHPVAQLLPNEWGLYDMSGNVVEWCWDKYDPNNPLHSAYFVVCGGYFDQDASRLRDVIRGANKPDFYNNSLGFRICRTIES
jgi:formylglycine-generating enzyme required for sulfatase activity